MTAIVFVGPSLAGAPAVEDAPDVTFLPPAAQGDVYRALSARPRALGIIDGYFEGRASVWHKEILYAMAAGVPVYGSASIGALRAAELAACGMIGVGAIFEAYRDGTLEADDEVALLHGPAELGFPPLTEPLVNVRATCAAAEEAGILSREASAVVLEAAQAIFYKERTWAAVLARAMPRGGYGLAAFEAWLPAGRVDRKRDDALLMLGRMRADLARGAVGDTAAAFEPTFLWERAVGSWQRAPAPVGDEDAAARAVIDELRLDPHRYRDLRMRAGLRLDSLRHADAAPVERRHFAAVRLRHRQANGLARAADLDRWLAAQGLGRAEYDRLIEEEAITERALAREDAALRSEMIALLKLDGAFAALFARAAAKAARRSAGNVPPPRALLEWFSRTRLGAAAPDDVAHLAGALGLPSPEALYGLLADEYLYLTAEERDDAS